MQGNSEQFDQLVEQLRQAPGLAEQLPTTEGALVRDALAGMDIYTLAQQHRMTEAAVWSALTNAARHGTGQHAQQVEVGGGLGSDFSPNEDEVL